MQSQSLIFIDHSPQLFNIPRYCLWKAFQNMVVSLMYLDFIHWIIPKSLHNQLNSFCGWILFKFYSKFHVDLQIYSHLHWECDGHTVNTLTQQLIELSNKLMTVHTCAERSLLIGCHFTISSHKFFSWYSKLLGTFQMTSHM